MPPSQPVKATRGVRDILPSERPAWRLAEQTAQAIAEKYGYEQLETPIIEPAELIERGVGEATDVVAKELYRFQDPGGRWLVLRPEGTAGTLRAYFEGGLNQLPQPARLYLVGPMFRHDRPQAGRYRQLYQFSLEAIGDDSPALDAEVIEVAWDWFGALRLTGVSLQLNSIGDGACRPAYREALLAYYRPLQESLCADCRRRLEVNPLRLLDCKADQRFVAGAPLITEYLCQPCETAFATVRALLDSAGIPYRLNPRIVRGLDYYTRTAFEFWHEAIGGQQNALGGGGRYDGLAADIGWPATPAVGFATGLDRTVAMIREEGIDVVREPAAEVLILPDGPLEVAAATVGRICRQVRSTAVDYSRRSLKAKMRSANRTGSRWVAVMNETEAVREVVQLREMTSGEQREVPWRELPAVLAEDIA